MNFEQFVAINYVVACLIIGYAIKETPFLYKKLKTAIPIIVIFVGVTLAFLEQGFTLSAFLIGGVSGLASTGIYEVFKNFVTMAKTKKEG